MVAELGAEATREGWIVRPQAHDPVVVGLLEVEAGEAREGLDGLVDGFTAVKKAREAELVEVGSGSLRPGRRGVRRSHGAPPVSGLGDFLPCFSSQDMAMPSGSSKPWSLKSNLARSSRLG